MCESGILVVNNSPTVMSAPGIIPLGTAVHGYGCGIKLSGNGIRINKKGYYGIEVSVDATPSADALIGIQLYVNGVAINGAQASEMPAAAADAVHLSFPWLIRKGCCESADNIQIYLTAAATVTNIIVKVVEER